MTGGLHAAGSAMASFATRHDVISNNLANVSTPGFARADTFLVQREAVDERPFRAPEVHTRTSLEAGPPILTGNPLDLTLEGPGFFTLSAEGGTRYTRSVSLRVDPEGFLRDAGGSAVLGENGLLFVGQGIAAIEGDGTVLVDGEPLDRLALATFAKGDDVERSPGGLYAAAAGRKPALEMPRPLVHGGQIEGSSVQAIPELVQMIEALRAYEAAASAVRANDTTLQRAVNDIARV